MKNYKKKYFANKNESKEVGESETFYGKRCLYCYEPLKDSNSDLHEACNKRFFGQLNNKISFLNMSQSNLVCKL